MRGSATPDRKKHLCARASVLCSGDRTVLWRGTDRRQMRAAQELYTQSVCIQTFPPAWERVHVRWENVPRLAWRDKRTV